MAGELDAGVLRLTAMIVAAHKGENQVAAEALPALIQSVYCSLAKVGIAEPALALAPLLPAVPIRKSVFPGHIVCLEDGQELKTLKRHLQASHGMTPEQYREKWGLPDSYPMVAPEYAGRRSRLSKQVGFGQKPGSSERTNLAEGEEPGSPAEPLVTKVRARRARVQGLSLRHIFGHIF